jgi:hypothetical protein
MTAVPENLNIMDIQFDLNKIAQKLGVEIIVSQSEYTTETA